MSGQIRIERLRTEEELQMELQRRSLCTLDHEELLAFADQLLAQWHRERVVKGLADRVLELEMEVSCLDGGGGAAVTPEHLQWARDLHQAE
jgi:asparagine synthetase B (glutamine-hydrolysing)